jgi:hypothetical protein
LETLNATGREAVGEPDEGKPHVRFDAAGDGNQDMVKAIRHSQRKRRATSCLAYVSGAIP